MNRTPMLSAKNYTHQYIANRQDWDIDAWCRKLKITRKKLETHPRIQDVALLLDFDSYQTLMNQKDADIWTHCWKWAYAKELALTKHHRRQLITIIDGIEFRQQRLNHIKARQNKKLAAV